MGFFYAGYTNTSNAIALFKRQLGKPSRSAMLIFAK
jgi:hypothetical protein